MSDFNPTISKTLNTNDQSTHIKVKICQIKRKTQLYAAYEKPTLKIKKQIKINRMKKIYFGYTNPKKIGVIILISNTEHFKEKDITRDKKGSFHNEVGVIHQDNITILKVYVPNIRAS